ncbi:MAG: hypothetical protein ACREU9_12520 [Gammaproteobacteria bacterium]
MNLQITPSIGILQPTAMFPAGEDSDRIAEAVTSFLSFRSPGSLGEQVRPPSTKTLPLEERLYDARALCKTKTAAVAMHLDFEWRSRFFSQLDSLMDFENWEKEDLPITEASFTTLLRMLLLIRPARRPGLGSTSYGNIIAAWTMENGRLTIECLPRDDVRWVLSRHLDGDRESAAGQVALSRLTVVLAPYNPERWFADGT